MGEKSGGFGFVLRAVQKWQVFVDKQSYLE